MLISNNAAGYCLLISMVISKDPEAAVDGMLAHAGT